MAHCIHSLRCMAPALQTSLRDETSRRCAGLSCRRGRAHRRLLPVHGEEGRVKVHILQQLPKAPRRAVQADRPPPVVLCDHVHAVGQVGPERRGALGLWEPARRATTLAPSQSAKAASQGRVKAPRSATASACATRQQEALKSACWAAPGCDTALLAASGAPALTARARGATRLHE